ncbi:hypothetical protein PENDEC_c014G05107 [Penicillium decumbens]|uniref:NAD-dependent epimerase/dehydratase domain-containing protein n=1 Tax=Penicillium decumbens TaxID=69771 RepID=A0A1V6PAN0_PENDC|nr:hypothetical protein PENDEC_c014G05107 [Penicillium decumbens]
MQPARILLTGATGYIGGTILSKLRSSQDERVKTSQIDVLIRGEDKVSLFENLGVKAITFQSLDETDFIRKVSSNYDVIINTASASHAASAVAMISGLHDRERATGQKTHFIHTSGTSNLGDNPITKTYTESRELLDTDDIYKYEQDRQAKEPYPQRAGDLAVFSTGIELGVKTTIIMPPNIFGFGTGPGNKLSIQIPDLVRTAIKLGQAVVIGDGTGEWDHVHVEDLAELYELVLRKVLNGDEDVPYGANGMLFAETGRHTWMDVSKGVASAGLELGALPTDEVRSVSLEEAASWNAYVSKQLRELGFASNSRSKAVRSRALGWAPHREAEWKLTFKADFQAVLDQGR